MTISNLNKLTDYLWEIPQSYRSDMRVPARIYATKQMLPEISHDKTLEQLINITTLPGIVSHAIVMPDAHEGYGFPIGGVAAFDLEQGIISPGGIGYDINCGVRLLKSSLTKDELQPYLEKLGPALYNQIPSGVGKGGQLKLSNTDLNRILKHGAQQAVKLGYGNPGDLEHLESKGKLDHADPNTVSQYAKNRGRDQLGTMGAGNHFVEIDFIDQIFDQTTAGRLGLSLNQICILIHTGSRGLGHQIATDYIRLMVRSLNHYQIQLPDRELACAPFNSPEGQQYFSAMSCGANFAWANRQLITHHVRTVWQKVLGIQQAQLKIIYDVAHNIAKVESYPVQPHLTSPLAKERNSPSFQKRGLGGVNNYQLLIHRKGATRAFPNQPVIIPGSMGTASYLLIGQKKSLTASFGSSCHGAGRRMSRRQAIRDINPDQLLNQLQSQGIHITAGSLRGMAEEAPQAYKDVDQVVDTIQLAGIANKVARLKPLAVIKG